MISTIIIKPTKMCNADCGYCSSPQEDKLKWTNDDFEVVFDSIHKNLSSAPYFIWHGGEPMMLGPEFYRKAYEYAKSKLPSVNFAIQTNLLLYKSSIWKDVFRDVMGGCISTSHDPDEVNRTINGSTEKYNTVFRKKLDEVISDDFMPLVIGTYTSDTIHLAHDVYDDSMSRGDRWYDFRVNYRYPIGRALDNGPAITPKEYGQTLIELFDRWCDDAPSFNITPLDQMLKLVAGIGARRCPWTRSCGGKFLGIEPNGDVYNCADIADLKDPRYRYGNIFQSTVSQSMSPQPLNFVKQVNSRDSLVSEMLVTPAAKAMKRRQFNLPKDCLSCEHFAECQGGCMRDAELYNRGLGGKFYYCESWKMVFSHLKKAVSSGRANTLLKRIGVDSERAINHVFRSSM